MMELCGGISELPDDTSGMSTVTTTEVGPAALVRPATLGVRQDDLPAGYERNDAGIICEVGRDDQGNKIRAPFSLCSMDNPVLVDEIGPDGITDCKLIFTTNVRGRDRTIIVPTGEIAGQGVRKILQRQLFTVLPMKGALEAVSRFLMAWVDELRAARELTERKPYGWELEKDQINGFSYADMLYTPAGKMPVLTKDSVIKKYYEPQGEAQPWYDVWEIVKGRPDLEAVVASAFAAPLMRFAGHGGAALVAYSESSGIGKTVALNLAQAVWGQPKRGICALNDTTNAVVNKLGLLRDLPAYWDEMRSTEQMQKFKGLLFDLTAGREKSRSQQSGQLRDSGEWQTILTLCGNASIIGFLAQFSDLNDADLMRVFEYKVIPAPQRGDPTVVQRQVALLNDHYGSLGEKYAEHLGKNHRAIGLEYARLSARIHKSIGARQEERFWSATISLLLCGAMQAKRLGLVDFNVKAMKDFLCAEFVKLRAFRASEAVVISDSATIEAIVAQFLTDNTRHTLYTDHMPRGVGRNHQPASVDLKRCDVHKLDGVTIHVAEQTGMIRFSAAAFREWCTKRKTSALPIIKELERKYGAARRKSTLGAGTQYSTSQQPCIEIDLTKHPELNPIS